RIMRVPKLNVRRSLAFDSVTSVDWHCSNPVVQVVNRDHERICAKPAVCGGITMAVRIKFCRSIVWRRIVEKIRCKVVKVITRPPAACALAVRKIWHRGTYDVRKWTNCIAIRTELRNRVDRSFGL